MQLNTARNYICFIARNKKMNLLFIIFICILEKLEAINDRHIEIANYEVIAFLKYHIVTFKPIVGYIYIFDGLF